MQLLSWLKDYHHGAKVDLITDKNVEANAPAQAQTEGLSQQQVNDIVKREKAQAGDRTSRDGSSTPQELEKVRAESAGNQPAGQGQS